ncbi:M55 family metallopeptidase [Peptoniphilus sp. KCTC 25270]|uniref:M55 family metallopeptidase n=1 Tax=Peptoniphilus sp. KCTC 25270 TaxID=2897414 RepID=UPI001E370539|nr:M55 family metallopeptidase [Peptoniphilus sp. KCTC 25270]MCD1147963.1 M55 family metallopeptidase [Peptoniphilus sp. KCTC 25270]
MKIYISFDMEGIAGINNWTEETGERTMYLEAIHRQMEYVIKGIQTSPKNKDITEITVCDAHNMGRSLDYFRLGKMDPRIQLIVGSPRREFMVHGMEGHDVAFFVGYHAGSGQHKANMEHSFSTSVHRLSINGIKCSEAMVNALYAKELRIPVALIIGDSGLYDQLIREGYMKYVEYVITKKSLGRFASKLKNPQIVEKETIEAVHRVLEKDFSTLPMPDLEAPYNITIEFNTTDQADRVERMIGAQRLDGYRVSLNLENTADIINSISVMTSLADK